MFPGNSGSCTPVIPESRENQNSKLLFTHDCRRAKDAQRVQYKINPVEEEIKPKAVLKKKVKQLSTCFLVLVALFPLLYLKEGIILIIYL
jgi:hypothetical protein